MKEKLTFYRPAVAAFLAMMAMAVTSSTLSFFLEPVCSELGIGKGSFSLIFSLMTISGAATNPILGRIAGKKGVRGILAVTALWGCGSLLLFSVYATLRDSIPHWPHTAGVVTHADKIRKWTQLSGDSTQVSLMDDHTFPVCPPGIAGSGYYAPNLVRRRRQLQDSIVRSRYYSMFNKDFPITGEHTRCFLVKSCYQDAEGKLQYDHPINIMDPVIWLLNDCLLQPREEKL